MDGCRVRLMALLRAGACVFSRMAVTGICPSVPGGLAAA